MIPKVIHYCWFGHNPLPELALRCIASWKKYLPDYEIKEWNEGNFDVHSIPYISEAYDAKKYAFVSDYARFWILYHYGGVYFDTDVEIIRPLNEIIDRGPFMGCESDGKAVAPGLGLACNPGLGFYQEMLDKYKSLHFKKEDGTLNLETVVSYTTEQLEKHGLQDISGIQQIDGIFIYPSEYFCPINITTKRLHITSNTYTIHHYAGSWVEKSIGKRIKQCVRGLFPESWLIMYNQMKHK